MTTETKGPIRLDKMTIPEVFQHLSELTPAKRSSAIKEIVKFLPEIKEILKLTFNKSIVFELPEGNPPYTALEIPNNFGYKRIHKELRKFKYFIKEQSPNLKQIKREQIFIEMLESVSQEEATLLLMIKDKKFKYKGITRKFLTDNLPEIFDGEELGKSNG